MPPPSVRTPDPAPERHRDSDASTPDSGDGIACGIPGKLRPRIHASRLAIAAAGSILLNVAHLHVQQDPGALLERAIAAGGDLFIDVRGPSLAGQRCGRTGDLAQEISSFSTCSPRRWGPCRGSRRRCWCSRGSALSGTAGSASMKRIESGRANLPISLSPCAVSASFRSRLGGEEAVALLARQAAARARSPRDASAVRADPFCSHPARSECARGSHRHPPGAHRPRALLPVHRLLRSQGCRTRPPTDGGGPRLREHKSQPASA
jgi:hypothetical protein